MGCIDARRACDLLSEASMRLRSALTVSELLQGELMAEAEACGYSSPSPSESMCYASSELVRAALADVDRLLADAREAQGVVSEL